MGALIRRDEEVYDALPTVTSCAVCPGWTHEGTAADCRDRFAEHRATDDHRARLRAHRRAVRTAGRIVGRLPAPPPAAPAPPPPAPPPPPPAPPPPPPAPLPEDADEQTRRDVVAAIQHRARGLGHAPTFSSDAGLAARGHRTFGSWRQALAAAGLEPHRHHEPVARDAAGVHEKIRELAADLGRVPTGLEAGTTLLRDAKRECGSWANAVEAAGFPRPRRGHSTKPDDRRKTWAPPVGSAEKSGPAPPPAPTAPDAASGAESAEKSGPELPLRELVELGIAFLTAVREFLTAVRDLLDREAAA